MVRNRNATASLPSAHWCAGTSSAAYEVWLTCSILGQTCSILLLLRQILHEYWSILGGLWDLQQPSVIIFTSFAAGDSALVVTSQ